MPSPSVFLRIGKSARYFGVDAQRSFHYRAKLWRMNEHEHSAQKRDHAHEPEGNQSPRPAEKEQELGPALSRMRKLCAELLQKHSRSDVEAMLEAALLPPPEASQVEGRDPERYAAEYRLAEEALRLERQEFLGVEDVFKGLLMFVESPEERVRKNLSVGVKD